MCVGGGGRAQATTGTSGKQVLGLHNGLLTLPLKSGKYLDEGEVSGARHVQSKLQVELGAKRLAYLPRTCRNVAHCSCIVCWVWCMQQQNKQSPTEGLARHYL